MFTEAIEVGDIQPFDYLQPEGQLSIDAVYIGTKSNGTHWVCYSLSYSDTEAVGLKYVIKMAEAFLDHGPCSRQELSRFDQFRSIAEDINDRAKAKAKAAEVNADTQPKLVGDITAMVSIPQCDPWSGEWGLSEVKMSLVDIDANDVGTFRAIGGDRAFEMFEVQL